MADKNIDDKIISLLRQQSTANEGFSLLMRIYGDKIYWHIRRIVVSHDDAEDVLQETSINIFRHFPKFKGESALSTWIYRIATNEAIRWLQRQAGLFRSVDALGLELADRITAENGIDAHSVEVLFQKALLMLPTQQRIAFNMRYYDELSYEEIAKVTGKNVNTLKANYHFAVDKIKNYIKENSL